MILSSRVKEAQASVTLTVNEKIDQLNQNGVHVYNMTSGQLPFKPSSDFVQSILKQLNFLKSYQYAPISGVKELRTKFVSWYEQRRKVNLAEYDCIISNGSKHSIYNVLGALINPGDEVITLAPYWVSYPEMIKFWGGVPIVVKSHAFDAYTPSIEDIEKAVSPRTKAIIVNSPNNPAGLHYSSEWMKKFAAFLKDHEDLIVISDELYSELSYFDPRPRYFYQEDENLLKQTVIINGISKSFASTGLRIGYCISNPKLIAAMGKIQSQTTSGANSLIQRALLDVDFEEMNKYFEPVKEQLRQCSQLMMTSFRDAHMSHCYYQTNSAFYYLLDFSRMPFFDKLAKDEDHSEKIVQDILDKTGVALVPGTTFGFPNSARMSMTLELAPFKEALEKLMEFFTSK